MVKNRDIKLAYFDVFLKFIYLLFFDSGNKALRNPTHTDNQLEIQTDTMKHRQTGVNTNTHTRKKDRQNKKRN